MSNDKHADFPQPRFTYYDLRAVLSDATFEKAKNIVKNGKVRIHMVFPGSVVAKVTSSNTYTTELSWNGPFMSYCTCYAGQDGKICSHVVALGLFWLAKFGLIDSGTLTPPPLKTWEDIENLTRKAFKYIKPYHGKSRLWFRYTAKLEAAALMLQDVADAIKTSPEGARFLWRIVTRLARRLFLGGVDDSDGSLGDAVDYIIQKIARMAKNDKNIYKLAQEFAKDPKAYDFAESLKVELDKVVGGG